MALLKADTAEPSVVTNITIQCVLDDLLAGAPARQLKLALNQLPNVRERQAVLCTACGIREEVARTCNQRADQIAEFLAANCEMYSPNRKPCTLQCIFGTNLANLA